MTNTNERLVKVNGEMLPAEQVFENWKAYTAAMDQTKAQKGDDLPVTELSAHTPVNTSTFGA